MKEAQTSYINVSKIVLKGSCRLSVRITDSSTWHGDGGLVASVRVDQLRVPSSSLARSWSLSFGKTTEWPKITHMLSTLSSPGTATLHATRSFRGQYEPLNKERGVTLKI